MNASIIPFKPRPPSKPPLPASPLPLPPAAKLSLVLPYTETSASPILDLTGKRKAIFLIGRGRIGKTTLARYIADTMDAHGASAVIAAADPVNRSLRQFQENVAEPPSTDPSDTRDWLLSLLTFAMEGDHNVIIDLGGGSTALSSVLWDMPDLATVLASHELHPVALHLLGPDPHDLVPLELTESEHFCPDATALILNEHHGRMANFLPVLQHATYDKARKRGAVPIWMPALNTGVARQCDANAWHYHDVANHAGPFATSAVMNWLKSMETAFAPIASWMPEA